MSHRFLHQTFINVQVIVLSEVETGRLFGNGDIVSQTGIPWSTGRQIQYGSESDYSIGCRLHLEMQCTDTVVINSVNWLFPINSSVGEL